MCRHVLKNYEVQQKTLNPLDLKCKSSISNVFIHNVALQEIFDIFWII